MAKVKTNRVQRKFARIEKKIEKGMRLTLRELALIGKRYAKRIAPYDTGRLASYIVIYGKGKKQQIKAKNPTGASAIKDGYRWSAGNYPNFNLVRWMHTSARAKNHFRGRSPKFMYITRDYLNSIKKGVATGRFRNINLR